MCYEESRIANCTKCKGSNTVLVSNSEYLWWFDGAKQCLDGEDEGREKEATMTSTQLRELK